MEKKGSRREEKNIEEKVVREVKDLRDQKDYDTGDQVPMIQKAISVGRVNEAE